MNRPPASLLLGACTFTLAYAAQRAIAPFAGLGLTLYAMVAVTTLAGFALGCLAGSRTRDAGRSAAIAAQSLYLAAALVLAGAVLRRPLLVALSGLELRVVVLLASSKLAGVPALLAGYAFARAHAGADGAAVLRGVGALLLGAALALPVAGWLLVPQLGLTLTLVAVAVTLVVAAVLLGARPAPAPTAVGALVLLLAAGFIATRPARAERLGPQLLAHRQGHETELRVFDRDAARYLISDGTIQCVVDTLSGDCVQRAPAALELIRRMRPGRDSLLVLGLRGGGLPLSFARAGWPTRVVEPDSDAVALSHVVSFKPGETPLEVSDPRRWLARSAGGHSVIAVDLFANSDLPWPLMTREFAALVAERLRPDGMAVWIVEAHGWGDPLVASLGATLRTAFPHVIALPTSEPPDALGTIVVLASRQPLAFSDAQLPDLTTYFQNPDALWFAQQMTHAWLNRYEPPAKGARVLSDDRTAVDVWADRINHATRAELHTFFGPHGGSW